MDWTTIVDWVSAIGERYGVNPTVFVILYFGGLPIIGLAISWMIRNRRNRRPIHIPLLSGTIASASAYLYVIVVGDNIPVWIYALVISTLAYALWWLVRKARPVETR